MSDKPTLAGVTIKTRKRNIVIPVDPGSFAAAIVQIIQDASEEGNTIEEDLEAAAKALDGDNKGLEFSRYSDTLFEVFFAGGMLAPGGKLVDSESKLENNILAAEPTREAITPYIKVFATLARRRPFLTRGLENTLIKLLLTSEFFDEDTRKRIGISLALVFHLKISVIPENIFSSCFHDRLVSKGTMLEVMTSFFAEFLAKDTIEDLVTILTKAKVVDRLFDFFPPEQRTAEHFNTHFSDSGLHALAEWNQKRIIELKIEELHQALLEQLGADPPHPSSEILSMVKAKKAEGNLPDAEVIRVTWAALVSSVSLTGKNGQQILQNIVQKIKVYHKLLSTFVANGKLELALLIAVQVHCYEDNALLKIFSGILRLLYDADIVGEDAVMHWYKKGSHPKGRNVFLKDIEPFIKWLEEAEEEEEA